MFACSDCFRWCQGKTMREAGFVLKQLEEFARKHPGRLLRLAAAPEQALAAAPEQALAAAPEQALAAAPEQALAAAERHARQPT
jgi:hypothetical protein